MSDPNYWPHTDQMSRRTLEDMRTFVSQSVRGLAYAVLPPHEKSQIDANINQEVEEWRSEFAGVSGYGEQEETLDWPNGQTRIEMPASFGEMANGGRAVLLDATGKEIDTLELASKEAWEHDLTLGTRPRYENRVTPLALLWGLSEAGNRILEIRPTPTTDYKIRVYFYGLAQKLTLPADQLEAPLGMHSGIEHGAASKFAMFANSDKFQSLRAEAERVAQKFRIPTRSERKRPGRLLSFHEVGGYSAYENPDKTTFTR